MVVSVLVATLLASMVYLRKSCAPLDVTMAGHLTTVGEMPLTLSTG